MGLSHDSLGSTWDSTPPGAPHGEGRVCNIDNNKSGEMLLSVTTAMLSANTVYVIPANPIVDSGATVSVVGRDLAPYADNSRPLRVPMEIVTANDNIIVNTVCDIPGNDIMNGAVIIESSAKSLFVSL